MLVYNCSKIVDVAILLIDARVGFEMETFEFISLLKASIEARLFEIGHSIGYELCREFGSSKFFNVAVLGVAVGSCKLGINAQTMIHEIETRVNPRFVEMNKKAFQAGMRIGGENEN